MSHRRAVVARIRSLHADERGTGLIGSALGVVLFLFFLLLVMQVVLHLYATSLVTSATYDAARVAAGDREGWGPGEAEAHARELLGGWSDRTDLAFTVGDDQVVAHVTAESPALLPQRFGEMAGMATIERTVNVRREQFRASGS